MKTVAERFVQAYTGHNRADLLGVLAPDVDFRGMTPGRFWEASTAEDLVDNVLFHWIDVHDVVQQVLALDRDWMADREHVSLYIYTHDEDFRLLAVEADGADRRPDLRVCIDTEADRDVVAAIYDALYPRDPNLELHDVIAFLDAHPEIAGLNRGEAA